MRIPSYTRASHTSDCTSSVIRVRRQTIIMADLVIRPAGQDDLEVLWDFLAIAAYEPDAAAAKNVPGVAAYLTGWQRPGDFGFVAERESEIIGAAWARQFATTDDLRVHYGDERTPKLSIGVKPVAGGPRGGPKRLPALIAYAVSLGVGLLLQWR